MEKLVSDTKIESLKKFWNGRSVLITGHSGFKGSWLTILLTHLGAKVSGISLKPETNPSLFEEARIYDLCESFICDINNFEKLNKIVKKVNPEIVFHLAAMPIVRDSYKKPIYTFSTNVVGTGNLLESIRHVDNCKSAVCITTDKVYENIEKEYRYKEEDRLGGHDPYSASKAACELLIQSYRKSFFDDAGIKLVSARAGNVIGGGDWSTDRLIPDAIKCWNKNKILEIRSPSSIRPWQHVLDSLYGYIELARFTFTKDKHSNSFNFGPNVEGMISVQDVIELSSKLYGEPARFRISSKNNNLHEAKLLSLDNTKSKIELGVVPNWNYENAVRYTIEWYKNFQDKIDAKNLCLTDINRFFEDLD